MEAQEHGLQMKKREQEPKFINLKIIKSVINNTTQIR